MNGSRQSRIPGRITQRGFSYWDPDAPPNSASALDDEFKGILPIPAWTEFDPNGDLTFNTDNGLLDFSIATHAGYRINGLYQTIPDGDFTITTKVSLLTIEAQYSLAGLSLWEDPANTAKGIYVFSLVASNSGTNYVQLLRMTDYDTWSATTYTITSNSLINTVYLRIRRSSTTYSFDFSLTGLGWKRLYSNTLAIIPTAFGPFGSTYATGITIKALFNFFRYQASDIGITGLLLGNLI